jgi:hypothetical protein
MVDDSIQSLPIEELQTIRELPRVAADCRVVGVLEQAPCYRKVHVAMAAHLLIDLIPVASHSTGRRQPMDVRVFGVLKRKQSRIYEGG